MGRKMLQNRIAKLFAVAAVALGASQAMAGYSTVGAPATGEQSQAQILSNTYGGTFISNGVNLTNGAITAVRVEDTHSPANGVLDAVTGLPGSTADQVWTNGNLVTKAEAVFATQTQSFGYYAGASGATNVSTFFDLFDVTNVGYLVNGGASVDLIGQTYRLGRTGNEHNYMSSLNSDNADGRDHMVTYQITGLGDLSATTWMVFFEDRTPVQGADFDYNDLAVQIKASPAVPLPAAAWTGLATMLGAGVTQLRRFRMI